jgi:hypothetical protein
LGTIKIVRNAAGNCINFQGSTLPVYFNTCLSGQVNQDDASLIDVVNDIKTSTGQGTFYELFGIPYTVFRDANNDPFASAQDAATYITAQANVLGSDTINAATAGSPVVLRNTNAGAYTSGKQGKIDPTNVQPGWYYRSSGEASDKINWVLLGSSNQQYSIKLGELTAVYTVTSVRAEGAPFFVLHTTPESDGSDAGSTFRSSIVYAATGSLSSYIGQDILLYIGDNTGLYPTIPHVELAANAAASSGPQGSDEIVSFGALATPVNASEGYYEFVSNNFGYTNNGNTVDIQLSAVPTTEIDNADVFNFVHDATGFSILISDGASYSVNTIQAVVASNGTITIRRQGGGEVLYEGLQPHNVTVNGASAGTQTNVVNNALNTLFTDAGAGPSLEGDESTVATTGTTTALVLTGSGEDPIGGSIWIPSTSTSVAYAYSTDTIESIGEKYHVKMTGEGRFTIGLVDKNNATDWAEVTSGNLTAGHDGLQWGLGFYPFSSYTGPWSTFGTNQGFVQGQGWNGATTEMMQHNATVQEDMRTTFDPVHFKIEIMSSGHVGVYYYDAGRSNAWILCARSSYVLTQSNYALVVKMFDSTNIQLTEEPEIYELSESGVNLTYYFIESPDESFSYPIFSTQAQANYYDALVGGVSGSSAYSWVDDSIPGRVWYMPNTSGTFGASSAPANTADITWNRIHTLDDADFAPAAFTGGDITVNEGAPINLQVAPADASYTTTISVSPAGSGLVFNGYTTIMGNAPTVTGDNITNPNDVYTVTVSRTNNYGTSTGTFNYIVQNLTAPAVAASGWTWDATSTPLIASGTMNSESVVNLDDTLDEIKRLIFPKTWVQDYVLPALTEQGDKVWIGVKETTGDLTDGITDSDWRAYASWESTTTGFATTIFASGSTPSTININSQTTEVYDYAFEHDDSGNLHVIGCNVGDINTQPGINHGGVFSRTVETTALSGSQTITMTISGSTMDFSETGISEIIIPRPNTWFQVTEAAHVLSFDGATTMPTLQAGYTYRFLVGDVEYDDGTTATSLHAEEVIRFTADGGSTEYTTGITRVGTPGASGAYIEFTVPSDVPPLQWYTDYTTSPLNGVTTSGSTYVTTITGITKEGPAANQTGTNITDNGDYGWVSVDEPLAAGERFVMDNAFFTDLLAEMDDQYEIRIGLKGDNWDNGDQSTKTNSAITGEVFKGDIQLRIYKSSQNNIYLQIFKPGNTYNQMLVNTVALHNDCCAFIDITSTGDNVRMGFGRNGNLGVTAGSESTTTYANWNAYKGQTGNQGYGITSLDVMFLVTDIFNGNNADYDGANVDWTLLSEVNVPAPPATNTTPWTKALDFSGGSEHAKQVSGNASYTPISMGSNSNQVAGNTTAGYTASAAGARPWATAIVFQADGNSSNQHIWNYGEGAGTNDDNIFLRVDASRRLHFGWGRQGAINECLIHPGNTNSNWSLTVGSWYGIYIGFTGERLSGANATAANLADCFDIRLMGSSNSWATAGNADTNVSTAASWASSGARMDRGFAGDMTIGGRGGNRNFHGKVASMVVTTLNRNVPMPVTAEIQLMITDPNKWLTDYKVGNSYRLPAGTTTSTFVRNSSYSASATQVWLMGDVSGDGYAQMRNLVYPATQNETPMNMINMVSSDITTVSIPGLT